MVDTVKLPPGKFFQKYAEYEEAVKLSNKGRTIQAALLTVTELVPRHIRACLSRTIFDGTVLEEDNQRGTCSSCEMLGG